MKYVILKRDDTTIIIAEFKQFYEFEKTRLEIIFEKQKIDRINIYTVLTFIYIVESWKSNGFKEIKKFICEARK